VRKPKIFIKESRVFIIKTTKKLVALALGVASVVSAASALSYGQLTDAQQVLWENYERKRRELEDLYYEQKPAFERAGEFHALWYWVGRAQRELDRERDEAVERLQAREQEEADFERRHGYPLRVHEQMRAEREAARQERLRIAAERRAEQERQSLWFRFKAACSSLFGR
jgi:hypothetical protein